MKSVTKIYKLHKKFKKYQIPGRRPLTPREKFRRYVAKRKFEIAFEAYYGRPFLRGRKRFFYEWGPLMFAAAIVAVLAILRHFGIYF
jgi:hypothetical protein